MKMKDKILIKLIVPEMDASFDLFIPVNELVWKIKKLILKSIHDMTNIDIDTTKEYLMINQDNCRLYQNNEIIINTDIRNGTELIMILQK